MNAFESTQGITGAFLITRTSQINLNHLFSITLPGLRGQIGVCLTMTIISALASFDVVYMSTQGGPGTSTMVPGVQVYRLAFTQQSVGLASALAVTLMIPVLLVVGPLQRLVNGKEQ